MIRAFLFDIGNVLLRFDFTRALDRLRAKCDPASEIVAEMWEPIQHACEVGHISRPEFEQRLMTELRFTGTNAEFISAWQEIFEENQPMTALVERLRGHYPLYLLSNTSDIHLDYIFHTYPVFQRFDAGIYSHLAKCKKPERGIYETAIEQLGLNPGETIFIDDMPQNVQTGREMGFHAIHYSPDQHDALLAELARLGVPEAQREISV